MRTILCFHGCEKRLGSFQLLSMSRLSISKLNCMNVSRQLDYSLCYSNVVFIGASCSKLYRNHQTQIIRGKLFESDALSSHLLLKQKLKIKILEIAERHLVAFAGYCHQTPKSESMLFMRTVKFFRNRNVILCGVWCAVYYRNPMYSILLLSVNVFILISLRVVN